MQGDRKVIEVLNKALRFELTAVSQYWLHYRLMENWGFRKLAKKEKEESIEEMHHADKLADRIIQLDGYPNFQTLEPLQIGQSLKEALECDLQGEYNARALYIEARKICNDAGDYVTQKLFETLLADEEGHIDFIETELALIGSIGIENYGLLQADTKKE
ncbi:bacterioferritin [Aestuariivirga sp.]|uniref:bacterioferritin n=1 Tax=Aestuariivirga sp. TaxID=2650926 RepID=UPI0039E51D97